MQPYAWLSQPCTSRIPSSPIAVWDGVPPALTDPEPWVGMETPDGTEPFQLLHGKDLAALEEVVAEVAAK